MRRPLILRDFSDNSYIRYFNGYFHVEDTYTFRGIKNVMPDGDFNTGFYND